MIDKFLLPDRYEGLENCIDINDIPKIIIPVQLGIDKVEELYEEMFSSGRGSFLILKGSSGCGKTTLLKVLGMLDKPEKGTVFYKGKDTKEYMEQNWQKSDEQNFLLFFRTFVLWTVYR